MVNVSLEIWDEVDEAFRRGLKVCVSRGAGLEDGLMVGNLCRRLFSDPNLSPSAIRL